MDAAAWRLRPVTLTAIVSNAIEKETMKAKPRLLRHLLIRAVSQYRIVIACLAVNENGKSGAGLMMAGFNNL